MKASVPGAGRMKAPVPCGGRCVVRVPNSAPGRVDPVTLRQADEGLVRWVFESRMFGERSWGIQELPEEQQDRIVENVQFHLNGTKLR